MSAVASLLVKFVRLSDVKQQCVKLEHRIKITTAITMLCRLNRKMLQLVKLGDITAKCKSNMVGALVANCECHKIVWAINPT